jgi:hypothetical protein
LKPETIRYKPDIKFRKCFGVHNKSNDGKNHSSHNKTLHGKTGLSLYYKPAGGRAEWVIACCMGWKNGFTTVPLQAGFPKAIRLCGFSFRFTCVNLLAGGVGYIISFRFQQFRTIYTGQSMIKNNNNTIGYVLFFIFLTQPLL